ncbi:transposase, partial [Acinetobacter johnsonii]
VFKGLAGRGKSSTGWFYGFKLHKDSWFIKDKVV